MTMSTASSATSSPSSERFFAGMTLSIMIFVRYGSTTLMQPIAATTMRIQTTRAMYGFR